MPGQLGGYPQARCFAAGGGEPGGGEGHGQLLVRPPGVVVLAPGVGQAFQAMDGMPEQIELTTVGGHGTLDTG